MGIVAAHRALSRETREPEVHVVSCTESKMGEDKISVLKVSATLRPWQVSPNTARGASEGKTSVTYM